MTAVDRAKRFLQNKARAIALTAIPLSALVHVAAPTPAKAGVISTGLAFTGAPCSVFGSGSSFSVNGGSACSVTQQPLGSNGVRGLKMTANGGVTQGGSGSGFLELEYFASGPVTGSFNGTLPVQWNFTLADSNNRSMTWFLNLFFNNDSIVITQQTGTTTGGLVSGSASPSVNFTAGTGANYDFDFFVELNNSTSGETITATIPGSSIDVNPVSAPEPSTWALALAGGLGLLGRRLRKKA